MKENRLNDLDSKAWMRFLKSWFVHNPPPRKKNVLAHPAKFPEGLVQENIEFFTKAGQTVLDPMCGTGSALLAAVRSGRKAIGIELNPKYVEIAQQQLAEEPNGDQAQVWCMDSRDILSKVDAGSVDYCITSPPYWTMLRRAAVNNERKKREEQQDWDMYYSDDPADLGNEEDYQRFIGQLVSIYAQVVICLKPKSYMTVIVKNLEKEGRHYCLAWDLKQAMERGIEGLAFKGERLWLQDAQKIFPFGIGYALVTAKMHQYLLNFRWEPPASPLPRNL